MINTRRDLVRIVIAINTTIIIKINISIISVIVNDKCNVNFDKFGCNILVEFESIWPDCCVFENLDAIDPHLHVVFNGVFNDTGNFSYSGCIGTVDLVSLS